MFPARPRDPEQTATALRAWLGTKLECLPGRPVGRLPELTGHQINHLDFPTRTPQSLIGAAQ